MHASIPLNSVCNVADAGTGTGVWLRQVAFTFSTSKEEKLKFVGFDISPQRFPTQSLPSTESCTHDAMKPFPSEYLGRFDLVNIRLLSYAIRAEDLDKVINNIVGILSE